MMPWYTQDCPKCGILDDVSRSVEEYKVCAECGGPCEVKISPTLTVGIVWSNQESSKQLGTHWETNAQKRAWMKRNPNVVEMNKGDANDKALRDQIRSDADRSVQKKGYRDLEHYRSDNKKTKTSA